MTVDQATLQECLEYNADTGEFIWRARPLRHFKYSHRQDAFNTRYAGTTAGRIDRDGYVQIRINRRRYFAHRLAWLYVHGSMPDNEIDHINHKPGDNRLDNLRQATRGDNARNKGLHHRNKSGTHGVWQQAGGKWGARISLYSRRVHLGTFATKTEAVAARRRAESEGGYHPNHGERAAA